VSTGEEDSIHPACLRWFPIGPTSFKIYRVYRSVPELQRVLAGRHAEARLHASRFRWKISAKVNRGAAAVFSEGAMKSIKKERGRE